MKPEVFQRGGRKQHKQVFILSRSLLLNRLEPESSKTKLLLPIMPIGIVAYAFTLSWDNLSRNSCMLCHVSHTMSLGYLWLHAIASYRCLVVFEANLVPCTSLQVKSKSAN